MTNSRRLPPITNKPGTTNWVQDAGGLPSLVERIARHLVSEQQYTTSRAIATAVNTVRKVCSSGRAFGGKKEVNAKYRAQCCAAAAEWEAKKGKAKLQESVALLRDEEPEITPEQVAVMAARASERLALLERAGLPATGPGAEFDRLLVEAAALPASARVQVKTRGGRTVDVSASHARRMHANGTLAAGQTGKFDESKHPRGGKGSATGGKFVSKGASGTEVRAIQRRVNARVDGAFGDKTKAAVMSFQKKHGLEVDGVVGRQTVAAMRGRGDAKRVKVGSLSSRDREFLTGHIRGKGRTATKLVEAVAAPDFLARVQGLELGELARLPDGRAVKHHASEDGRDLWTPGGPSTYAPGDLIWSDSLRTAEDAVARALSASAASGDPASLGGTTRYGNYTRVTVNGRSARFASVAANGKPLVRYDDSEDMTPVSWPALSPDGTGI